MSFLSLSPNTENELQLSNKILYISKTKYENDWLSLPHLHHFTELMLIIEGEGNFVSNEKFYPVKKGCLIIIENNFTHTEVSSIDKPLSYYSLGLKDIVFSKHLKNNFIFEQKDNYINFSYSFEMLFNEMNKKFQKYEKISENLIDNIIITIERITKTLTEKKEYNINYILQKAIEFIDENYNDEINLEKLCEITFFSKSHLNRLFKENTSLTPMDYLLKRRLISAKTLLITTELSISEIAMMLNFPSVSSFIDKFKKEYNSTPLKFRKSNI